jgi:hypothetical protein
MRPKISGTWRHVGERLDPNGEARQYADAALACASFDRHLAISYAKTAAKLNPVAWEGWAGAFEYELQPRFG